MTHRRRRAVTLVELVVLVGTMTGCGRDDAASVQSAQPTTMTRPATATSNAVPTRSTLRIMTFNIRYDEPADGENAWPLRRSHVAETLRGARCDIIGFQEMLEHQRLQLLEELTGYDVVARPLGPNGDKGETAPILFDASRWSADPAEQGTFWLSETPDVPGSTSWDGAVPKICTWARLVEQETGRGLYVYNVHLDHRSPLARQRGAELVVRRAASRTHPGEPAIVLGDFNSGTMSPPGAALRSAGFVDAIDVMPGDAVDVRGTFHNYGRMPIPLQIDHVFVSPQLKPRAARTLRDRRGGVYLSDHYPLQIDLAW